jgi:hypothetical protein
MDVNTTGGVAAWELDGDETRRGRYTSSVSTYFN